MSARIHDVRYRPYAGPVQGTSRRAIASMARWSALRALGARRRWTAKVVPITLALVCLGPAIVVLGFRALFGPQASRLLSGDINLYAPYYDLIALAMLAYAAIVIPETICPDRRSRVLDLYLSTAMSPLEYVAGKIAASVVPLLAVTTLPLVFLYVGNIFFSDHPLGYVQHHLREAAAIPLGGLLIAVTYTLLGLAVASLTSRRAFATVGFVLLLIVSALVGGILGNALDLGPNARLANLQMQPIWLAQRLIGPPAESLTSGAAQTADAPDLGLLLTANAAVIVVCLAVLALRYRRSSR